MGEPMCSKCGREAEDCIFCPCSNESYKQGRGDALREAREIIRDVQDQHDGSGSRDIYVYSLLNLVRTRLTKAYAKEQV